MKTTEIDARGLACPAPVLQTKAAIENEGATVVRVTVDNAASAQNVSRFLQSRGFSVEIESEGSGQVVVGRGSSAQGLAPAGSAQPRGPKTPSARGDHRRIMVMITSDRMGHGDEELGAKLMVSFLKTVAEMGDELWRLAFVNSGVKLTIDGSPVLDVLQQYEAGGLQILVCGTCLTHFDLLERKQAGVTTNMLDIVTAMQLADKVINI
ncbi:MAG TPA: sulfurtransferase-like selenium metabolism protein YedF [Desulfobacteraceae bacterium]|nr:sulfurtransferase-like selenium metabolism protein YedF [Deltaproteobacteria bacterium]MBW2356127.1 sulfurtransferase-like selenium metabolism protein YedF [Deltaproteobacteria bacterium]HDI61215.1 sulfurtransferase-like selenium metabolism protein YedF [Desulfobacteraceae bacterium]